MQTFRVEWKIDIEADTAEDAARQALAIHRKADSIATVFDVWDSAENLKRIDLSNIDQDETRVEGVVANVDVSARHWQGHDAEAKIPTESGATFTNAQIVDLARERWHDEGECEIDDGANDSTKVSRSITEAVTPEETDVLSGAYVKAWVWVDLE